MNPHPQLVEIDDDVTTDHIRCPFCTGELCVRAGVVSHSSPGACEPFASHSGKEIVQLAKEEERKRICKR